MDFTRMKQGTIKSDEKQNGFLKTGIRGNAGE